MYFHFQILFNFEINIDIASPLSIGWRLVTNAVGSNQCSLRPREKDGEEVVGATNIVVKFDNTMIPTGSSQHWPKVDRVLQRDYAAEVRRYLREALSGPIPKRSATWIS